MIIAMIPAVMSRVRLSLSRPGSWRGWLPVLLTARPGLRAQAPAPAASISAAASSYVLSPDDAAPFDVFQEDELRTSAAISKDGTINFPPLNSVRLGGLAQAQARDLIGGKDPVFNGNAKCTAERPRARREAVLRLPPLLKSDYDNLAENEIIPPTVFSTA